MVRVLTPTARKRTAASVLQRRPSCCGSDRERNPDPEEIEAPLVVALIPDRLLLEAPVVDRRRRRTPCLRQRSVPRRRRRCAPTPRRGSVAPRCSVEASPPVVVTRVPRRSPVVVVGPAEIGSAGDAGSAEVRTAGSSWAAEVRATWPAGSVVRTAGSTRPTRPTRSAGVALRSAGSALWRAAGSTWTATRAARTAAALCPRRRHARCCGCHA
jgi:hypothetical protein